LTDLLDAEFAKRTTAEWLELLTREVPIAPVQSLDEALERDFLRERSMLVEYEHPTLGAVASVGIPIRLDGFEPMPRPGPLLGQDRDQILRDLGADEREIASLAERGAFGSASLDGPSR
jgi:crotonobetainyl-CoA:carnitine CoA-transferase CaiB-like acyl-CoA transferase